MVLEHKFKAGFGLIELLISIFLGSFLLLVITNFSSDIKRFSYKNSSQLRLQQETHKLLNLLIKDIRRAGFMGNDLTLKSTNFALFFNSNVVNIYEHAGQNNACILFFYDLDNNACIGAGRIPQKKCEVMVRGEVRNNTKNIQTELFGYKLEDEQIKTRILFASRVNHKCKGEQCRDFFAKESCSLGDWRSLLDPDEFKVKNLAFNLISPESGSKFKQGLQINLELIDSMNINNSYASQAIITLPNW